MLIDKDCYIEADTRHMRTERPDLCLHCTHVHAKGHQDLLEDPPHLPGNGVHGFRAKHEPRAVWDYLLIDLLISCLFRTERKSICALLRLEHQLLMNWA